MTHVMVWMIVTPMGYYDWISVPSIDGTVWGELEGMTPLEEVCYLEWNFRFQKPTKFYLVLRPFHSLCIIVAVSTWKVPSRCLPIWAMFSTMMLMYLSSKTINLNPENFFFYKLTLSRCLNTALERQLGHSEIPF